MKTRHLICGLLLLPMIFSCSHQQQIREARQRKDSSDAIPEKIVAEAKELAGINRYLRDALESHTTREIEVEPVMPAYDPLEDRMVSFSMVDEDFKLVLYSLSRSVGMNLIIDPEVKTEEKKVTINFENVSAAMVLREILDSFNLYYETDGNILRVRPFQEKLFRLNFLDTSIDTDFLVGGDVLGETEGIEGLTGSFKLSGKGSEKEQGNAYDVIEAAVQKVLSSEGKYVLNRMAGTLYVKDRPESVRSISRLVNNAREILSRQILIIARIIEVVLRDEFDYGIDWDILWQEARITDSAEASLAWNVEEGLQIEGVAGHLDISAAIKALETFGDINIVSNPSLRVKHAKPAIISVGTSISYIKSTSTTILDGISRDLVSAVETAKVFDGLILGVVPFIQDSGKISLLINPIRSDVDKESLVLVDVGTQQVTLPVVNIKEVNSTITLNSGDAIILGGLIDNRDVLIDRGVPGLSAIPGLGYLFKDQFIRNENRELVIILSVTEI